MKKFKAKFVILTFLIVFSGEFAIAQTYEELINNGKEAFLSGDYYNAMNQYGKAIKKDSSDLDVVYHYAESCRLFNNYLEAERWYQYVCLHDEYDKYPLSIFWLAVVNKNNGHYVEAGSNFKAYYNRHKNVKDFYTEKSKFEIEACKYAQELIKDTLPVRIEHLGNQVNSPFSEFGAMQLKDSVLIFSALKQIVSSEFETLLSGVYLSKVYESKLTLAGPTRAKPLESRINSKDEHTANVAVSDDLRKTFFTKCYELDNANLICSIYLIKQKEGKWMPPEKLPENINMPGYTNTQPTIMTGKKEDVLYFVSDRPGGQGGLDIWYSVVKDDHFYDPVNLGSIINTPGNEISPFYFEKTGTLFFSSDWHKGLGGYDIFSSLGSLNEWTFPENLGYPVNTSCNEMYYTVNQADSEGYFTSNRPGSFYIKGETCCNDIFYYEHKAKIKKLDIITEEIPEIKERIRELLPLTLYFHNDVPDPGSRKSSTSLNYKETLAEYIGMKDIYREEYSKGLTDKENLLAKQDIESFFNDFIERGFKDLEKFSSLLLLDLKDGNNVKITIKGYTSPLNTAEYNVNLAKRRISSLINYLREYKDGVFLPYLNGNSENGARLEISEDPIGEAQASKLVSDNPQDVRNSVYSRAAAMERRIQIILYVSDKTLTDKTVSDKIVSDKIISTETKKITDILFNEYYHDLGTISGQKQATYVFNFENIGEHDLMITGIKTTCGCTAVEYTKNAVKPGEIGEIRILLDAKGKQGSLEESIIIDANIPNGFVILGISALVPE